MPLPYSFEGEIAAIVKGLTKAQAKVLAKQLSGAFVMGYELTGTKSGISDLQRRAIKAMAKEQLGYIAEFNNALGSQMQAKVIALIKEGKGMAAVKEELKPFIKEMFGENGRVVINRVGETKDIIQVLKDGTLRKVKKEITREYSTSVDAYSDMLSRTSVHTAQEKGRTEGYKSQGFEKWRYISAQDERVRPEHQILSGRVFLFGTSESEYAEQVLSEPNCRCRKIPFFDNPKYDTPQAHYDKLKEKAGLYFDKDTNEWAVKEMQAPKSR